MYGHKVLIVEDHPDTADILTRLLQRSGFQTASEDSGEAALTLLRSEEPPDAVVLDQMMPGMSGLEVLQEIRHDERLKDLPVILYSADATPERINEAYLAGAHDYVIKG